MWDSCYRGFGVCNAPSTKFIAHTQLALSDVKVVEISEKVKNRENRGKNAKNRGKNLTKTASQRIKSMRFSEKCVINFREGLGFPTHHQPNS